MYISTHQLTQQHWDHSVQARPTGGDEAFTSAGKKIKYDNMHGGAGHSMSAAAV